MGEPNYAAACVYVMERLTRELDSRFLYHGVAHTRDDVLPAVERLAIAMGVTGTDLVLLRTAALCHDTGFLVTRADHEMRSVQFVEQELPRFGYTAAEIAQIGVIIWRQGCRKRHKRCSGKFWLMRILICWGVMILWCGIRSCAWSWRPLVR